VLIYAGYVGIILLLLRLHPERVDHQGELIQVVALLGSLLQITLIGGNISELRAKLRHRTNELHEALARISEMANRDELTGVYNRRYLLKYLESEIDHCARGTGPLCVSLLDIDFFKRVNDTHGHVAGDVVLTKVAGAIQGDLRKIDCFGRYGGEEFLLVMPQTHESGAHHKVEKLRLQVKALDLGEIAPDFHVTLSAGVAEYQAGETLVQFIARADCALYRAKELGRDRALVASGNGQRKAHGA
jgi:diguanylate cyclase (GGDEF)-like protein